MGELFATWGKRVAQRRTDLALSQKELAELIGVTQSAIAHIEAGHVSATDATRMRLAGALRTRVEDLFPYPVKGEHS